jgi:hypothetical protein
MGPEEEADKGAGEESAEEAGEGFSGGETEVWDEGDVRG